MSEPTILLSEDDASIRTILFQALTRAGFEVKMTPNAATIWQWVSAGEGDLLLTDVMLPDENMFNVIPKIRKLRPNLPVIVMSAENTVMTAIKASEVGAYEYLPKPFDINELISIVRQALKERSQNSNDASKNKAKAEVSLPIIGRSISMQNVYRTLARLIHTELTVIIYGESGTGKELVARALHDYGKRKNGPFIAINMAAIPKDLIESELFGHEKGAFTGADQKKSGRFEQAEGGTLFLDEIGDMHIDTQTRLLRVLQEGEFTRVGGHKAIKANVRIIAATHKDLQKRIEAGLFREDLYYRLNVVPIKLPPLRSRLDDIPDLVKHFISLAQNSGLDEKHFTDGAMKALQNHSWPGNIRELENVIWRILALNTQEEIDIETINSELSNIQADVPDIDQKNTLNRITLSEFAAQYFQQHVSFEQEDIPASGLYQMILSQVEPPLIRETLKNTSGNQMRASEILGINRNTLRKKMQIYQIQSKAISD